MSEENTYKPMINWVLSTPPEKFSNRILMLDSGKARLGSIYGWLDGLADCGKEDLAQELKEDLFKNLKYLGEYAGDIEDWDGIPVPKTKCVLADDGTKHGFSFRMFRAVKVDEVEVDDPKGLSNYTNFSIYKRTVERWVNGDCFTWRYEYWFNGGLIYHGPGAGETFSVTLNPVRGWSVHT